MSRQLGKAIIDDLLKLPHDHIRKIWRGMTKDDRVTLFGNGHAEELDELIKSLGTKDTAHLSGDEFGGHLQALHSGDGVHDDKATRVLHTASGVRMSVRAVKGPGKIGKAAHEQTMRILNGRYKEKD